MLLAINYVRKERGLLLLIYAHVMFMLSTRIILVPAYLPRLLQTVSIQVLLFINYHVIYVI